MPARRNDGLLAEDEGRLLEPSSSREDEECTHRTSADNTVQQSSQNPDLSPNPDPFHNPSPSATLSSDKFSATSKTHPDNQGSSSRGKQRNKSPNQSEGAVKAGSGRGRSSPGQPQQKVVYYQNRFITIPIEPGAPTGAGSSGGGSTESARGREAQDEIAGQQLDTVRGEVRSHPIDMEPIALDEPGGKDSKTTSSFGKAASFFKSVASCLEDNRLKTGNQETQDKIKEINTNVSDSHRILKKILNILFVTTGVSLFLAVIIVIIYTSIGKFGVAM